MTNSQEVIRGRAEVAGPARPDRRWFTRFRLDSVQVALWVGGGGALIAGTNLVLAGLLAPVDFGWLALFQSILTVGVGLAPLGIDNLIARREVPAVPRTLLRLLPVILLGGCLLGGVSALFYAMPLIMAAALAVGTGFGAFSTLAAARERAALRLNRSQVIAQAPFVVFLLGALAMALGQSGRWQIGAVVLVAGYGTAAIVGALLARTGASSHPVDEPLGARGQWSRAFSFLGINASVRLLLQLERLLIPYVLTMADLATFTVVAMLVGSPSRLLQAGSGYALLPRLRSAPDAATRSRLLKQEIRLVGLLAVGGGLVLLAVAGPLIQLLYGGKYVASFPLVLSVVLAGWAKAGYGIAEGVIGALGTARTISRYNRAGWLVIGATAALAAALAGFGLPGIIAATGIAWVGRIILAYWLIKAQPSNEGT